ncbi:MAG: SPASM domain-containing protein [Thermodesulfovibrionales bacterium]|nr:SPASM domain-containing protein [Thermodesulfovibrionales bacterium]
MSKFQPYGKSDKNVFSLHEMLPVPVPLAVHIDPSNKCNFKCVFCPTGDNNLLNKVKRPSGVMDINLFKKIINQFIELTDREKTKIKRLQLYKDGEPLINKNFVNMAEIALNSGIAESVETTTNASLLNRKKVKELISLGLDVIRISIEGISDEAYKSITQTFNDYDKILNNVKNLFYEKNKSGARTHIHIKTNDVSLSSDEKNKFLSEFTPISDSINIDALTGWSNSHLKDFTLGQNPNVAMDGVTEITPKNVCPEVFTKLSINHDGTVSICCVDWAHDTVIGNLNKSSVLNIWDGKELRDFRLMHLRGEKNEVEACKSCHYMTGFPTYSNIDNYTDKLISIYTKT